MNQGPKGVLHRLAEGAALLLASALAIHWAWELLRPLLPVLIIGGAVAGILMLRRSRHW